jgi:hypothetical protein
MMFVSIVPNEYPKGNTARVKGTGFAIPLPLCYHNLIIENTSRRNPHAQKTI